MLFFELFLDLRLFVLQVDGLYLLCFGLDSVNGLLKSELFVSLLLHDRFVGASCLQQQLVSRLLQFLFFLAYSEFHLLCLLHQLQELSPKFVAVGYVLNFWREAVGEYNLWARLSAIVILILRKAFLQQW